MTSLRKIAVLMVLCISGLACSLMTAPASPTASPEASPTASYADTPTAAAEASDTPAPAETISPTDTPNPLSLSMPMPFMNLNGVSQYFNPAGQPAQTWNDIPIMPEATAGQEFKTGAVYSFKATASIAQAVSFYSAKIPQMGFSSFMAGPGTGSAGTGSNAMHNSFLYYIKGSQVLLFYITSFDTNPGQVIVVISTQ